MENDTTLHRYTTLLYCCNCINVFVSFFVTDYRCLIILIICDFCYFFALLTRCFAAINTNSIKRLTDAKAKLTSQTWFIYIQQCNAVSLKNTTQQ